MTDEADRSPAATLDLIRDGGIAMMGLIRSRMIELEEFLDKGDFDAAYDRAQEVASKLQVLGWAQSNLASLAMQQMVRARDLEEGMGIGRFVVAAKEVETHECVGGTEHTTVKVTWADDQGEANFDGNMELLVKLPE